MSFMAQTEGSGTNIAMNFPAANPKPDNREPGSRVMRLKLDVLNTECLGRPINQKVVKEYAELWKEGTEFPRPIVFHSDDEYFLGDGGHRCSGAEDAGFTELDFEVRSGTRSDALKYALGANVAHGCRRTAKDKRFATDRALAEFPDLADRQISEMCAVSPTFVAKRRKLTATVQVDSYSGRLGRDGKRRKLPRKGAKSADEPIDVEASTTFVGDVAPDGESKTAGPSSTQSVDRGRLADLIEHLYSAMAVGKDLEPLEPGSRLERLYDVIAAYEDWFNELFGDS